MSKIEWTDATWNPVTGCTKVSPGCENCYAERMAKRLQAMGQPNYVNGFEVTTHEHVLEKPLHWKGPRKIFVCSMSDLFHEDVPFSFIARAITVMGATPRHTYQILTKRPHRMAHFFNGGGGTCLISWPLPNVQLGVSVETPDYLWRVDDLLTIPAAVHFVSLEPMLEPIDISIHLTDQCGYYCDPPPPEFYIENEIDPYPWDGHYDHRWEHLDWVIVGAESGPNDIRRPFEVEWALDIYYQCQTAGVPVFMKQDSGARPGVPLVLPGIGEVKEWPA